MKRITTLTPVKVMKLTMKKRGMTVSKTIRSAGKAAEFYVMISGSNWWDMKGHLGPRPGAYDVWRARDMKMYSRVLKVFQKYLP